MRLRLQNYLNFIISHPDFLSFKLFFTSVVLFILSLLKKTNVYSHCMYDSRNWIGFSTPKPQNPFYSRIYNNAYLVVIVLARTGNRHQQRLGFSIRETRTGSFFTGNSRYDGKCFLRKTSLEFHSEKATKIICCQLILLQFQVKILHQFGIFRCILISDIGFNRQISFHTCCFG